FDGPVSLAASSRGAVTLSSQRPSKVSHWTRAASRSACLPPRRLRRIALFRFPDCPGTDHFPCTACSSPILSSCDVPLNRCVSIPMPGWAHSTCAHIELAPVASETLRRTVHVRRVNRVLSYPCNPGSVPYASNSG